jgi:hypothetical protein
LPPTERKAAPDVFQAAVAACRCADAAALITRSFERETTRDGAVEYRGTRYRSLSEVARLITGTRWSGPLFFGGKKTRQPG